MPWSWLTLPSCYEAAILGKKAGVGGIQCEAGRSDQRVLFWALEHRKDMGKERPSENRMTALGPRLGGLTLYCKSKDSQKRAGRRERTKGKDTLYKYVQRHNAREWQICHRCD